MHLSKDVRATSDIMETLLALMLVSGGVLLMAVCLPSLLSEGEGHDQKAELITSRLIEDGIVDLVRAERMLPSFEEGTAVRLITADGIIDLLKAEVLPERDRFVARTPVLVHTVASDFPALLEVACVG